LVREIPGIFTHTTAKDHIVKAALFTQSGTVNVVDRPEKHPGPGEIVIAVESCGVCGTDLHIVEGTSRSTPPVVLGHEFAGVIESIGPGVTDLHPGQRIAADPNISCGTCSYCRRGLVHLCARLRALGVDIDGGMAERCVLPAAQAHVLPRGFPVDAAPFVEPVSCAVHGIDRAGIKTGDTVVITGGGTIGLIMLQLSRHAGASQTIVVEPLGWKREIAQRLGATIAVDGTKAKEAVRDLTVDGADVVIECAGSTTAVDMALELARRGGTVEVFGVCRSGQSVSVEPHSLFFRELTVVGSYVNPHTFARAIEILAAGIIRVDAFRVSRFSIDNVHNAFSVLRDGGTHKSMIVPAS